MKWLLVLVSIVCICYVSQIYGTLRESNLCKYCEEGKTCCCNEVNECVCKDGSCMEWKFTDSGSKYTEYLIEAIFNEKSKQWEMGKTSHSSEFKQGDKVWWPTADDKLEVQTIARHNVTDEWAGCCGLVKIGLRQCESRVCCSTPAFCCCH